MFTNVKYPSRHTHQHTSPKQRFLGVRAKIKPIPPTNDEVSVTRDPHYGLGVQCLDTYREWESVCKHTYHVRGMLAATAAIPLLPPAPPSPLQLVVVPPRSHAHSLSILQPQPFPYLFTISTTNERISTVALSFFTGLSVNVPAWPPNSKVSTQTLPKNRKKETAHFARPVCT